MTISLKKAISRTIIMGIPLSVGIIAEKLKDEMDEKIDEIMAKS
jgi:hypothetical protein